MNGNASAEDRTTEAVEVLESFRLAIRKWDEYRQDSSRAKANRLAARVQIILDECGVDHVVVVTAPPIAGGHTQSVDAIVDWSSTYYGMKVLPKTIDAVDRALGVVESTAYPPPLPQGRPGTT